MAQSLPASLSILGLIIMELVSTSQGQAKRLIKAWRIDYNECRPHMALGNKMPLEYFSTAIPLPQAEGLKPPEN